jgi:hypothetical protein
MGYGLRVNLIQRAEPHRGSGTASPRAPAPRRTRRVGGGRFTQRYFAVKTPFDVTISI